MNKSSKCPAIRVVMMPAHTNGMGNIFGGVILSYIDVAGAIGARETVSNRLVTVCMKEVVFKKPVHVNDLLTCWAEVTRVGKTSITTHVEVEVSRNGKIIQVTDAIVVYVAVDSEGKPTPVQLYARKKHCRRGCPRAGRSQRKPASRKRSSR